MEVFGAIREMDEEDCDDFSRVIVEGYVTQSKYIFDQMHESLKSRDLDQLSSLGHFLKCNSRTVGATKIAEYSGRIQHLGVKKDVNGLSDVSEDESLAGILKELTSMEVEFEKLEKLFTDLYPAEE